MLDEKKEVELKGRRHDSEPMRKKGPPWVVFRGIFSGMNFPTQLYSI